MRQEVRWTDLTHEQIAGHLAAGSPADVKKELSGSSARWVESTAEHYQKAGRGGVAGVSTDGCEEEGPG